MFRILKHWLRAGDPDPYYNPVNDYVILPAAFDVGTHKDKGLQITSLKEEWEIISASGDADDLADKKAVVSCHADAGQQGTYATVIVHPKDEGKQHIQVNAVNVGVC